MIWRFLARWRRFLTGALIPLAAVLALSAGSRRQGASGHLEAAVASVIEPFQSVASGVFSYLEGAGEAAFGGARLRRENQELRQELSRLRREVQESRERVAAAARCERLLGYRESAGLRLLAAGVIGHDAASLYQTIVIDRGTADGLKVNQAVLTPEGAVGRTIRVYPRSALVLLLVDRSSGIDAIVQRTRDQGVVQGLGGQGCELKYVARQAEMMIGDYVVTSGAGGVFPKGIWIGQVARVQKGGYLFQHVEVQPTAPLDRLEEVLVVLDGPQEPER
jgi:rod shape-determining protein MreC